MSLFPRAFGQELSPLLRMMDDYASLARNVDNFQFAPTGNSNDAWSQLRKFQPKFDVSETKDAYMLHGELPGIEGKDVKVEWTDGNTITISGRTEHRSETRPATEAAGALEAEGQQHYEKPSVEDKAGKSETEQSTEVTKTNKAKEVAKNEDRPKYWVSERSVGEFHRTFSFPARVDQDNVKASMKNGILEITVPKATKAENKRIEIQ